MELLRIKELLKEKGITSKDLADKLDVTPATVSNINNGNHFPKPDLLLKIAEVLDVDIRELFVPTKTETSHNTEVIYIEKDGRFINIGELRLKNP